MTTTPPDSGSAAEKDLLGQRIGKYKVTRPIGKGGMGAVYEIVHEGIGQRAALKVLFAQYAREPEFVERFLYEARVVNVIEHPGLVKISDHGQLPDGTLYIVMEFLEGQTLRARLEELRLAGKRLELERGLELVRQLAETLRVVHAKGVIHRDLKPENIFLVPDPAAVGGERAKILDFGIAKIQDGSELRGTDSPGPLTTMGKLLGTPTYMSPEQCEGQASLTAQSDVYALGVIWYELLTGEVPFGGGSGNSIMAQHILKPPPPVAQRVKDVPRPVEELVLSMLAKKPDERPTLAQLMDRLTSLRQQVQSGKIGRRPPLIPLAMGALVLAAAAGGAIFWTTDSGMLPKKTRPLPKSETADPARPAIAIAIDTPDLAMQPALPLRTDGGLAAQAHPTEPMHAPAQPKNQAGSSKTGRRKDKSGQQPPSKVPAAGSDDAVKIPILH